jgi:methionyl-tRNA formyltransferase
VSIMELEPKMDTGPVILCRSIPIEAADTTATLEPRLADLGAHALLDALPGWLEGELRAEPQDESKATYCSLLTKEDGHLDGAMTAAEAERAVRAYNPWPGAFVLVGQERLAIWGAEVQSASEQPAAGTVLVHDRRPAIAFREGALVLTEVQRPGSRRVSGEQYLNGLRGVLPPRVGLRD